MTPTRGSGRPVDGTWLLVSVLFVLTIVLAAVVAWTRGSSFG